MADGDDDDDGGGSSFDPQSLFQGGGPGGNAGGLFGDAAPNGFTPDASSWGTPGDPASLKTAYQIPSGPVVPGQFNPQAASNFLLANAYSTSQGICATNFRLGMAAGGLDTIGHPEYAGNYGSFLESKGFNSAVHGTGADFLSGRANYQPQVGDVAVLRVPGEIGHVAMYCHGVDANGKPMDRWVSDFQQNEMLCGSKFRNANCDVTVFRHPNLASPGNNLTANNDVKPPQPKINAGKAKNPAGGPGGSGLAPAFSFPAPAPTGLT